MSVRVLIAAFAVALVVPLIAALPAQVGPKEESLVEGHTVFAAFTLASGDPPNVPPTVTKELPLPNSWGLPRSPDGGSLRWFNDQNLLDPWDNRAQTRYYAAAAVLAREYNHYDGATIERFPCEGAVLAVNRGDPNPVDAFDDILNGGDDPAYVTSYLITDPNDHAWSVDKWEAMSPSGAFTIWTVAINNYQAGYGEPDNYANSCAPISDGARAARTGANGLPFPDGTTTGGRLTYNALLVFRLDDLLATDGSIKDHRSEDFDLRYDASGCDDTCPAGDDSREGNSHSYNPWAKLFPKAFASREDGGSASFSIPGQHGTREVDLYYGPAKAPDFRQYSLVDTVGSTARY